MVGKGIERSPMDLGIEPKAGQKTRPAASTIGDVLKRYWLTCVKEEKTVGNIRPSVRWEDLHSLSLLYSWSRTSSTEPALGTQPRVALALAEEIR